MQTLTPDGAWCWFQDPRALWLDEQLVAGWMTHDGRLQVGTFDPAAGTTQVQTLRDVWDVDDHNTLSLLLRPDGRLQVFYARHNKVGLYSRIAQRPGGADAWEPEITVSGTDRITYSHPFWLADEQRYLVVWRGPTWKPTFATSADGITWSEERVLVQDAGREAGDIRPYLKAVSDGRGAIHFAFTDGHPRVEPTNSVYYLKYEAGSLRRGDGTEVGRLDDVPVAHADSDVVYDARPTGARAWVWDIALDGAGRPVIAYTTFPELTDHRYHYARLDGTWQSHEIVGGGGWFPQTPQGADERETEYSGGLCLHHGDPAVVFLSRPVEGVFEIERWETSDGGASWTHRAVTRGSSQRNVRPIVPRGGPADRPAVVWMQGDYVHYTDYHTALRVELAP